MKEPFELVGMDLLKSTVWEGGNQYICVMVDYFTKWERGLPSEEEQVCSRGDPIVVLDTHF